MKFVTMVYYTKNGRDMVVPFENCGQTVQEAVQETMNACERVEKQALKQGDKIKSIRARTFEIEVPSFDVR